MAVPCEAQDDDEDDDHDHDVGQIFSDPSIPSSRVLVALFFVSHPVEPGWARTSAVLGIPAQGTLHRSGQVGIKLAMVNNKSTT